MQIFHNPVHATHAGRHEMYRGRLVPCHETPARLDYVLEELERRSFGSRLAPGERELDVVSRVHDADYLAFLASAWRDWIALDPANADADILPSVWPNHGLRRDTTPTNFSARVGQYTFDAGSPIMSGTWEAVQAGAMCAVLAARNVSSGNPTAAITRPPGHHAGTNFFGGYCFLNNSAIAAQTLREAGHARVAILDVDYHHGNGTQQIFYDRADVLTISIHGDPTTEYPFYLGYADERGRDAGEGCNRNYPLPRGTSYARWERVLDAALHDVATFGADVLVVPLGVDTYVGDPISGFTLTSDDFTRMGARLSSAKLPTVFVMEGGYAVEQVGVNVVNVLEGFRR